MAIPKDSISAQEFEAMPGPAATPPDLEDMDTLAKASGPAILNDLGSTRATQSETAYVWDIDADRLSWEPNVTKVLGPRADVRITTGQDLSLLIVPEHVNRRQHYFSSAHGEDCGNGVPYQIHYRFAPYESRDIMWLEENGRWWANDAGQPRLARGTIRRVDGSSAPASANLGADHDELTGQLNRIRLTAALDVIIRRAEVTGQSGAFLVAAINNLSIINETFGFNAGDDVIASVAKAIRRHLRGGDSLGRYSSNKFGIILNDCGPGAVRIAAERLIEAVNESRTTEPVCPIAATVSIGGVLIPSHASNVNQALTRALEALEVARRRRQDCFVAFELDPEKESARRRNISVAEEVRRALDEHRIHLLLQPIVRSDTRETDFYECLMRIRQPDGTVMSAGDFVEVAEQLGLSRQIDQRTLELAVDLLEADPDLKLSLNVSGFTSADHSWLVALHRLIGARRDIARRLTIEITETVAIHDIEQSIVFVDTLKELGCRVAIDDFGAGYTSFKNLKHLDVDIVKIDGSFVRNIVNDQSDRIFLRSLVYLARSFGMETVAEWVVDEPTAQIVAETGISHMQGFHVGEPVAPAEVSERLAKALAAPRRRPSRL